MPTSAQASATAATAIEHPAGEPTAPIHLEHEREEDRERDEEEADVLDRVRHVDRVRGLDPVEEDGGRQQPAQARGPWGRRLAARRPLARARGCSRSGRRRSPGRAARAGSPSRPRSRPGPGGAGRRRRRSQTTPGGVGRPPRRRRARPAPTTRAPPSCAGLWRKSATRGSSQTSPSTISGATSSATTIAAWRQRRCSQTSVAAAAPQATRIPMSSSAEAVIRSPIPGRPAATADRRGA